MTVTMNSSLEDDTEDVDEEPGNDDAPPADTQPPWARDDTVPRHQEAQGSGAASSADAAPTVTEPTVPDPPVQDPPAPSPFRSASYVNREQERLARRRARSDRLRAWEGWPERPSGWRRDSGVDAAQRSEPAARAFQVRQLHARGLL